MSAPASDFIHWQEGDTAHRARWRSEAGVAAPQKVQWVDDTLSADAAWRLASGGHGLLWRGDFQNARLLLQALGRRLDKQAARPARSASAPQTLTDAFHRQRMQQAQRARLLGAVLIELGADHTIALRRAPDWRAACDEAWGAPDRPSSDAAGPTSVVTSLRELLGVVGAHEWRKTGLLVPALGDGVRIHAHYGVFAPVRSEYLDLVARAAWPGGVARDARSAPELAPPLAFDLGTGTGVLAAVLARRGVAQVLATDHAPRALACARDNLQRLGLAGHVTLLDGEALFPPGRAPLVVCNPPWLPGKPSSALESAVYDPDSRMLRGFLAGLAAHLTPGGEGWLILSDLAEHLGLRAPDALSGWITAAGLRVVERLSTRPRHPKASDAADPLHAARAAELTSLWRLAPA